MVTLPPLRSIQVFEAVVRCGSVTAAADNLDVSAGAISQQIKALEAVLGVRLLERQGRSLELTEWGRIYYQRVHESFNGLRAAQSVLTKARSKTEIALSALPSLAIRWLRPLLQEWQIDNPGSSILLVGTEEEPKLDDDRIDFRITYGDGVKRFDNYIELFVDSVVPTCSPSMIRQYGIHQPVDILRAPLIDIQWDIAQQPPPSWGAWAQAVGIPCKPSGGLAFSLSSAAIDAAVDGGGFVLGQRSMIREEVANGRLVVPFDLPVAMSHPYYLVWNRAVMDTPFGHTFKAFLQKAGRRHTTVPRASGEGPLFSCPIAEAG